MSPPGPAAVDPDDVGTQIGQQHAAERARPQPGELHDPYALQRSATEAPPRHRAAVVRPSSTGMLPDADRRPDRRSRRRWPTSWPRSAVRWVRSPAGAAGRGAPLAPAAGRGRRCWSTSPAASCSASCSPSLAARCPEPAVGAAVPRPPASSAATRPTRPSRSRRCTWSTPAPWPGGGLRAAPSSAGRPGRRAAARLAGAGWAGAVTPLLVVLGALAGAPLRLLAAPARGPARPPVPGTLAVNVAGSAAARRAARPGRRPRPGGGPRRHRLLRHAHDLLDLRRRRRPAGRGSGGPGARRWPPRRRAGARASGTPRRPTALAVPL